MTVERDPRFDDLRQALRTTLQRIGELARHGCQRIDEPHPDNPLPDDLTTLAERVAEESIAAVRFAARLDACAYPPEEEEER